MNQLKTIIVGVDFSECSRRALEQAARLTRWNNAQLSIIHVQDVSELELAGVEFPPPLDELRARHRARAIAQLAEWAEQAGAPAEASREVINGSPLEVLLQASQRRRTDLLVLGATGESLLPDGTGTLATKCLRKASTKVMLVHANQVRRYRRVLACVDFSEASRVAVAQALHVAEQDQAELHLLHVFRAEWQIWNFHQPLPALSEFEKNYRAIMENNLRQFVPVPPRINVSYSVASAETHGAGIADYARRVGVDLVVLGSKGRTNLKYVLLGSTVERLWKEIACSVLVTRPPAADAGNTTAVSADRERPDPASAFKSMTNRPAWISKLRQGLAAGF